MTLSGTLANKVFFSVRGLHRLLLRLHDRVRLVADAPLRHAHVRSLRHQGKAVHGRERGHVAAKAGTAPRTSR